MRTFTWLGTSRQPGQFVEFCKDALVTRVAGMPPTRHVKAPVRCREGPMTVPDATPVATPELSPLVMGIVVPRLWAGAHMKSTLGTIFTPMGPAVIFG